jgi:type IV secretory pathway VirJ component
VSPKRADSMLMPTKTLETPWFVFQLGDKQACSAETTAEFVSRVDNAKLVSQDESIPGVSTERAWLSKLAALMQWLDPDIREQVLSDADVAGVPLTEVRAEGSRDERLAVMLSGDGGWAQLDRGIAATLAKRGIDTVGWDSLSYFWQAKTPEQAATDLGRVLTHYLTSWHKDRVLLIGYSFGADVLPFMVTRLAGPLRDRIDLLVFLGLEKSASFEFHLTDWIGVATKDTLAVLPEVSRLTGMRLLCVYGDREVDSACPALREFAARVVALPGDHHFGEAYETIVNRILEASAESPRR